MGSSNSTSTSNDQCNSSVPPATCFCCIPRPRWPNMLHKVRRTLQQRLNFQSQKRRRALRRLDGAPLRPMPRCSSFGSSGTLLAASKSNRSKSNTYSDTHYAQWKCMFEKQMANQKKQPQLSEEAATHQHDISEALAGQTTPSGFPSHTDPRRCRLPEVQKLLQQPLYDHLEEYKVRRRLSFRLPKLNGASSGGGSGSGAGGGGGGVGSSGLMRRPSARQKAAQAKMDKQLEKDLHDLEDYYGGFHYAKRNERCVRI